MEILSRHRPGPLFLFLPSVVNVFHHILFCFVCESNFYTSLELFPHCQNVNNIFPLLQAFKQAAAGFEQYNLKALCLFF